MDLFKENKEFWFYVMGVVVLFFLFFWGASYFLRGEYFGPQTEEETYVKDVPNEYESRPDFFLDLDVDYYAVIETNKGEFEVDLFENSAPLNVNNFIFLSDEGYYDGLEFYRLIDDLLIQGGSRAVLNDNPFDDSLGYPGYYIQTEVNWDSLDFGRSKRRALAEDGFESDDDLISQPMEKYSLVMANAGARDTNQRRILPDTAGSQFFIVLADREDPRLDFLEGRHIVIGKVTDGTDVIDTFRDIGGVFPTETPENESTDEETEDNPDPISRPAEPIQIYTLTVFER
jgi:cyclophilin family peptidyl-prolyl cis-trans isomerase